MPGRKQARYSVDLPVEFRHGGHIHEGRALNLSVGGMYVQTTVSLPFGATVALRFAIPEPKEDIEVDAQVRWVEGQSGAVTGVGVQFLNLRARHVWALNKFFDNKEPVG